MFAKLFITKPTALTSLLVGVLVTLASTLVRDQAAGWWLLIPGLLLMIFGGIGAAARPGAALNVWLGPLLVLVVPALCMISAWVFYLSPTHSSSPLFDRHGLLNGIPLPDGVTFVSSHIFNIPPEEKTEWLWISTDSPATLQQFYLTHLDSSQWLGVNATQRGPEDLLVSAGGTLAFRLLWIEAQSQSAAAQAPPGGSVLTFTYVEGP